MKSTHETVAVCARTHSSDQVLTGNYLQNRNGVFMSSTACDDQLTLHPDDIQKCSRALEEECRLARERGKTVCVWDSPRGINPTPGCTGKILHVDHFVFCPFCGKPIKVKP
jgi:hypothetical protein